MTKILIADDSAFMRNLVKMFLKGMAKNFSFLEADNGEDAVTKYKENNPDIVFLDISMSKKDAIWGLREIIKFDPSARVVICSAMGQEGIAAEAFEFGAVDLIVKPFRADNVARTVNKILTERTAL